MRMFKNHLNLEMTKGDTLSFGIKIYNLGQNLDTAYFTCKKNYDSNAVIFQKSLNNGITFDSADASGNYVYKVRLAPEDTADVDIGKYYYDVQISCNGDIYTIMKGVFTIDYEVTLEGAQ